MNKFNIILMVVILVLINSVLFIDIDKNHKLITLALIVVLSFTALYKTKNLDFNVENFQNVTNNVPTTGSSFEIPTCPENITPYDDGSHEINTNILANNNYCHHVNLVNVKLSSDITVIQNWSFFKCINLTTINLQDTQIEIVEAGCFSHCLCLKKIELPVTVTRIESFAFSTCCLLEEINLRDLDKLEKIGQGAFFICGSLRCIVLPDSITRENMGEKLGENAFGFDVDFANTYLSDLQRNVNLERLPGGSENPSDTSDAPETIYSRYKNKNPCQNVLF